MSQERAEIVGSVFHLLFVRRDFDAAALLIDAGAVMDWSDSRSPYSAVYRGHAEIREMWQEWQDAWDEWSTEIKEAIDVDSETVVITTLVNARGKGSGVPVQAKGASVWVVRDGKITYGRLYQSKAEALAAVELSDEARPRSRGAVK